MKRTINIIGLGQTAAILSAGVAAAASVGLSTGQLGAGNVPVTGCTSSSLTAIRNVDNSGNVTEVKVLAVPQSCAGETLALTLENSSHASLGTASTTIGPCTGGCTVSLTGFGTVSATSLRGYALSLTG